MNIQKFEKANKVKFLLFIVLFVFLFLSFFTVPLFGAQNDEMKIQILNSSTNEVLFTSPVHAGDVIGLKFIHSYDKGAVTEYFNLQNDGHFLLQKVLFSVQSYDAREQTYPKAKRTLRDGVVHLENIDQFYKVEEDIFRVRVPYTVPQWLIIGDQHTELSSIAPQGTLLEIRAKN